MANDYLSAASPLNGSSYDEEKAVFHEGTYLTLLGVVGLLIYSYWNMLVGTSAFWQDDQYSHGFLMPLIALYLMWAMRPNPTVQSPLEDEPQPTFFGSLTPSRIYQIGLGVTLSAYAAGRFLLGVGEGGDELFNAATGIALGVGCLFGLAYVLIGQPIKRVSVGERWIGLAIVLAGYGVRLLAAQYYSEPLDRISFLIALVGAFVMVGGLSLLRWTGAGLGFLIFMYPIPSAIEQPLLLNLQKVAAMISEMILMILNQPVTRTGNTIQIDGMDLLVAEACSGLRMVTIFGGFAVACALLIKRPWWDKLVVLLSAIPIALIANVTRIVVTALLYRAFPDSELIHQVVHDYAGLAMMPLGMGLLYLLLKVLSMLTVEEEEITGYDSGAVGGAFT